MRFLVKITMMKIMIVVGAAFVITFTSRAQDSSEFKRNEIGINVVPLLIELLGAQNKGAPFSTHSNLSIHYKRHYKKSALRSSINYAEQKYYYSKFYYDNFPLDSTATLYKRSWNDVSLLAKAGYQYQWGKNDFFFYAGADFIAGFAQFYSSYVRQNMMPVLDTLSSGEIRLSYHSVGTGIVERDNSNIYKFGIAPFVGIHYFFSPHFSLSAESYLHLIENIIVKKNKATGQKFSYTSLSFDFNNIIDNISFNFHF